MTGLTPDDRNGEQAWEQKLRERLDQEAANLDAATLSRLKRVRVQAMERRRARSVWQQTRVWGGGLAMAGVCGLAILIGLPGEPGAPDEQVEGVEFAQALVDTDILFDEQSIEFYDELEFYLWLEREGLNSEGLDLGEV